MITGSHQYIPAVLIIDGLGILASNTVLFDFQKGSKTKDCTPGCCDSRGDPAIITDCDPGDLFVIRNVANLVAPHQPDAGYHGVAAALEFAVQVIMRREHYYCFGPPKCGGISAYCGVYHRSSNYRTAGIHCAEGCEKR
ncbi:hypothetical protein BSLG_008075 [Batrachochytrium salamandrivorans]|nr:hypothetical protein BSLG_008075 [Batrachochytrium salamandrivorans]